MGELTVSGYPRTGTTYLQECLKIAFTDIEIVNGFHKIKLLTNPELKITTLRNPLDSVSSWIVFCYPTSIVIDDAVEWYCSFVSTAIEHIDSTAIFEFDSLIANPNQQMQSLGRRIGIDPLPIMETQISKIMQDNYARSFPNINTQKKQDYYERVINSSCYSEARNLYAKASTLY